MAVLFVRVPFHLNHNCSCSTMHETNGTDRWFSSSNGFDEIIAKCPWIHNQIQTFASKCDTQLYGSHVWLCHDYLIVAFSVHKQKCERIAWTGNFAQAILDDEHTLFVDDIRCSGEKESDTMRQTNLICSGQWLLRQVWLKLSLLMCSDGEFLMNSFE